MSERNKTSILLTTLVLLGCAKTAEPESYQVVSHNAITNEWIIIHRTIANGEPLTRRFTLECISSIPSFWEPRESVYGPTACLLEVGRKMVPTLADTPQVSNDDGKPFLVISENLRFPGGLLIISERAKSTKKIHDWAEQHFSILKNEVVNHP